MADCAELEAQIQEFSGKIFLIEVTIMHLEYELDHVRDDVFDALGDADQDMGKGNGGGMQQHLDEAERLGEEADAKEAELFNQLQSANNELVCAKEMYNDLKAQYCANGCQRRTP